MDHVTGTPCKGVIAGSRPSDSILADMRRFVTGNTEAPASHLGVTEASLVQPLDGWPCGSILERC